MSYSDFTYHSIRRLFGKIETQVSLFGTAAEIPPNAWLLETLERGRPFAYVSEKARSESIVWPILLACRELLDGACSIYSGVRLDVDAEKGLKGECDFLLTRTSPEPEPNAPLVVVVEAKQNDIEGGLGQCAAQMLGAARFNEIEKQPIEPIYGCVTTGDGWQFLRLEGDRLWIDRERYYLRDLGKLLGIFVSILKKTGS